MGVLVSLFGALARWMGLLFETKFLRVYYRMKHRAVGKDQSGASSVDRFTLHGLG